MSLWNFLLISVAPDAMHIVKTYRKDIKNMHCVAPEYEGKMIALYIPGTVYITIESVLLHWNRRGFLNKSIHSVHKCSGVGNLCVIACYKRDYIYIALQINLQIANIKVPVVKDDQVSRLMHLFNMNCKPWFLVFFSKLKKCIFDQEVVLNFCQK